MFTTNGFNVVILKNLQVATANGKRREKVMITKELDHWLTSDNSLDYLFLTALKSPFPCLYLAIPEL